MKMWTFILAAGVCLALAAPAANSAIPREMPARSASVASIIPSELVKVQLKNRSQAARIKALLAKNAVLKANVATLKSRVRALDIAPSPAPAVAPPAPPVEPDEDSCLSYVLCTPEQDCRIWGNNCQLVMPSMTPAPATEPATPTESIEALAPVEAAEAAAEPTAAATIPCASAVDPWAALDFPSYVDSSC